jgi:hypothetical protein
VCRWHGGLCRGAVGFDRSGCSQAGLSSNSQRGCQLLSSLCQQQRLPSLPSTGNTLTLPVDKLCAGPHSMPAAVPGMLQQGNAWALRFRSMSHTLQVNSFVCLPADRARPHGPRLLCQAIKNFGSSVIHQQASAACMLASPHCTCRLSSSFTLCTTARRLGCTFPSWSSHGACHSGGGRSRRAACLFLLQVIALYLLQVCTQAASLH